MNNGFTIIQNAVTSSFIWSKTAYRLFWIDLVMKARPTNNTVFIRGVQIECSPHTVVVSTNAMHVYGLTRKAATTMLRKLVNAGIINMYTERKRTFVTLLDTEYYKYPKTKNGSTAKQNTPTLATAETSKKYMHKIKEIEQN
jgi:hypothetical protein